MRSRHRKQHSQEYYKLLDNSILPTILKPSRYSNPVSQSAPVSPQKTAERIVKSQHFLYIDLDQESGCRVMEKQVPQTQDQDIQKIGNSYIWNLKNLSNRNQQTIDYLSKLQQSEQQKLQIRKIFKTQLQNSLTKLNKRKKYKLDYSQLKQRRQLEFDPFKLRELVEADHLDSINQSILGKERKLIEKLGILNNYVSAVKDSEGNAVRARSNSKLPHLNFSTIQR